MQTDHHLTYKMTAQRTGGEERFYKDLGSFVLQELHDKMDDPPCLILRLKGVGFWYLRRQRMRRMVSYFPPYYEEEGYNDFPSESAFLNFVNKKKLYDNFKLRLLDYDRYIALRNETNLRKHEFKQLHSKPKEGQEPSPDQPS